MEMQGKVYSIRGNTSIIKAEDDKFYKGILKSSLPRTNESILAVGDIVEIYIVDEETAHIVNVLPRKNKIARPDPHDKEKILVMASNIDQILLISSFKNPDFNPGFIDRFLLYSFREDIEPILVINKYDLVDVVPESVKIYQQEFDVLFVSAETGMNLDLLKEKIIGRTSLLAGASGVGKSTIINKLFPGINVKVDKKNVKIVKGRHVTSYTTIYELDKNTLIIDSPGIRKIKMDMMDPLEVQWYFPEIDRLSHYCKFSNCLHLSEPECAVRTAVKNGEISQLRYSSYLRILNEILNYIKNKGV